MPIARLASPPWVLYRVTAVTQGDAVADRFVRWMIETHGPELLAQPGCLECRVYREGATVRCEYLFESRSSLETYLSEAAPALRAKGRAAFPETEVIFSREILSVVAAGDRFGYPGAAPLGEGEG